MRKSWEQLMRNTRRTIDTARAGDKELGPFKWLPEGAWVNKGQYGWNLIALPYIDERRDPSKKSRGYRLLVNKYKEELEFKKADKGAPNRGVEPDSSGVDRDSECVKPNKKGRFIETDQFVLALDYEQEITQVEAKDFPKTDMAGVKGQKIHHEPGLFLRMTEPVATTIQRKPTVQNIPLNLARLATIPHGDSVLALGSCQVLTPDETSEDLTTDSGVLKYLTIPDPGKFPIGLPIGTTQDVTSDYLEPYREARIDDFDPTKPQEQLLKDLKSAIGVTSFGKLKKFPIRRTTRIWFDSELETGGILNIPFVTRQANAASMRSTFWIHELDDSKNPKLVLQYSQVVLLDFHLIRSDDKPGRIRWPHISINTLVKVPKEECPKVKLPKAKSLKKKLPKRKLAKGKPTKR